MKICRFLLVMVVFSSVFTFTHLHEEGGQMKISSERVAA